MTRQATALPPLKTLRGGAEWVPRHPPMKPDLVRQIADTILDGFNRHFSLFRQITRAAKARFEAADWEGEDAARRARIDYYDQRVSEAIDELNRRFDLNHLDARLWQDIKRWYMWLLYEHKQPELAESFYNSVFCRLFDRSYYNNDHIFVKPGRAIDYLDMDDPAYTAHYPDERGLRDAFRDILLGFDLRLAWEDLERDLGLIVDSFAPALQPDAMPAPHRQLHVLSSLFFRNKAAYIVGRALVGVDNQPFVLPLLINDDKRLYVDTILTEADDLALIFSFTRAYFMVDTEVPAGLIDFLQSILPSKTRADLYTGIGFQKQGKTLFYREFLYHLQHSTDKLVAAPGIKGMVMCVFTLPSYPYVFKVIKDRFARRRPSTARPCGGATAWSNCTTASGAWPTLGSSRMSRFRSRASPTNCWMSCAAKSPPTCISRRAPVRPATRSSSATCISSGACCRSTSSSTTPMTRCSRAA